MASLGVNGKQCIQRVIRDIQLGFSWLFADHHHDDVISANDNEADDDFLAPEHDDMVVVGVQQRARATCELLDA